MINVFRAQYLICKKVLLFFDIYNSRLRFLRYGLFLTHLSNFLDISLSSIDSETNPQPQPCHAGSFIVLLLPSIPCDWALLCLDEADKEQQWAAISCCNPIKCLICQNGSKSAFVRLFRARRGRDVSVCLMRAVMMTPSGTGLMLLAGLLRCSSGGFVGEINKRQLKAGRGRGQNERRPWCSNAALCHVTAECIDDGKHESAFMKILSRAGRC